MRTTIRLDDALLRQAKARAAEQGRPLNDFIADAVRAALAGRVRRAAGVALPTFAGRGLQAGVDLDDASALLDLMEPAPGEHSGNARQVAEREKGYRPKRRGRA